MLSNAFIARINSMHCTLRVSRLETKLPKGFFSQPIWVHVNILISKEPFFTIKTLQWKGSTDVKGSSWKHRYSINPEALSLECKWFWELCVDLLGVYHWGRSPEDWQDTLDPFRVPLFCVA